MNEHVIIITHFDSQYILNAHDVTQNSDFLWRQWYYKHVCTFQMNDQVSSDSFQHFIHFLETGLSEVAMLRSFDIYMLAINYGCQKLLLSLGFPIKELSDSYLKLQENHFQTDLIETYLANNLDIDTAELPIEILIRLFRKSKICTKTKLAIIVETSKVHGKTAGLLLNELALDGISLSDTNGIEDLVGGKEFIERVANLSKFDSFNNFKRIEILERANEELMKKLLEKDSLIQKLILEKQSNFNTQTEIQHLKETMPTTIENPHYGILRSISDEIGSNAIASGDVTVTAYDESAGIEGDYSLAKLIEWDIKDQFYLGSSAWVEGEWIQFDFGEKRKVQIEAYTIMSSLLYFQKSWLILGSNDTLEWTEIDKQKQRTELCGEYHEFTFKCNSLSKPFRYIRMANAGPNSNDCTFVVMAHIEFFGRINVLE